MEEFNIIYINYEVENYTHNLQIPMGCFVVMAGERDAENYDVLYNGKKINDAYAVIRYGNLPEEEKIEPITNWKEIIEGE